MHTGEKRLHLEHTAMSQGGKSSPGERMGLSSFPPTPSCQSYFSAFVYSCSVPWGNGRVLKGWVYLDTFHGISRHVFLDLVSSCLIQLLTPKIQLLTKRLLKLKYMVVMNKWILTDAFPEKPSVVEFSQNHK